VGKTKIFPPVMAKEKKKSRFKGYPEQRLKRPRGAVVIESWLGGKEEKFRFCISDGLTGEEQSSQ